MKRVVPIALHCGAVIISLFLFSGSLLAQDFMLQSWYWDYPKPGNPMGNPATEFTWAKNLNTQASDLADAGFTMVWLPPLSRASFGSGSNGYDPKDLYDLGEYGLGATGFGFRADVNNLVASYNALGIEAIADVVYNHRDGGLPEQNNPVRDYITTHYNASKEPYPSDRYRILLPIGGSSDNGAGDYFFKISSKTQDSRFHNKPYVVYTQTSQVGWQNLPDLTEQEPNGGGQCGEANNNIELGRNLQANIDASGCTIDEFKLSVNAGDFNASGDFIEIYLTNPNGDYADHRIFELFHNGSNVVGSLLYQTYTDFTSLPSGQGSMNFENFRPRSGTEASETLTCDWNCKLFFYDYDQDVPATQTTLFDWTSWLWDNAGMRGLRMDAVKHFNPAFVGQLLNHLHGQGKNPNMVVGEFFDGNVGLLNNWVSQVQSNMSAPAQAAIDVRAFDFHLREHLKDACDAFGYDVRNVFNAGMVENGANPFSVVTFVNNHDFRGPGEPVMNDPMLAYAYILTNNKIGLPCVFYPEYYGVQPPNYPAGVFLQQEIDQLLEVHKEYIFQAPTVDYLSRFGTPYAHTFSSGLASTTLLFQIKGGIAGKDVIVAINFAGEPLDVNYTINSAGIPAGEFFTDVLGRSNGATLIQLSGSNQLRFQVPARSYAVWVQGDDVPLLPVDLLQFQARTYEHLATELSWETAAEVQLRGFDIERSRDGINFETIGFTASLAEEGEGASYLYMDKSIRAPGHYYYRLRMINQDESYEYSNVEVAFFKSDFASIELSPNPTTGVSYLTLDSYYNNIARLEVFDAAGRRVIFEELMLQTGINQVPLDLSKAEAGVYFVRLHSPGDAPFTARLVLSK